MPLILNNLKLLGFVNSRIPHPCSTQRNYYSESGVKWLKFTSWDTCIILVLSSTNQRSLGRPIDLPYGSI